MLLNRYIPLTFILSRIKYELVYASGIWLLTYVLSHQYSSINPEIPVSVPAFIGTAIAVILSFKLNQSYDRWWEARKVWGSIVNESRNLVWQLDSFLKPTYKDDLRTIALRQIAWCYCLGQSLRGQDPMANVDRYLSAADLEEVKKHNNKPLEIIQLNGNHVAELKDKGAIDTRMQIQVNNTLISLTNAMGMAERIKSTVFPVTYRHFLHWMIYLFTVILSLALYDVDWYIEFPMVLFISCAFFLLEKAATQLQDPFENNPTDTPMTSIATNIEINIKDMLHEQDIPQPLKSDTFYSL